MKIISFAKTTAALLAGHKSVTRRYWNPRHAASFKPGETVQAWDKSPRFGGKKVAEIKILAVYQEDMKDAPESDYEKEGFQYMCDNNIPLYKVGKTDCLPDRAYWRWWRTTKDEKWKTAWVVRFEVTKII
ncbi:MAG: hypothetical protein HOP31_08935 [Ignavibacteria bacterium]|nr:hypothetical protein [Ignavibacteria bacterium]